MTTTTPHYLRVHRAANNSPVELHPEQNSVSEFWDAYADATGWRVDGDQRHESKTTLRRVDKVTGTKAKKTSRPAVSKQNAQALAEVASALAKQLQQTNETLLKQSVELAARAAIVSEEKRGTLAKEIRESLANAAVACRCDAAAICLLDDDTEFLTTRSVFGLPETRLSSPPRELRAARGDLESMVRGVVAISDLNESAIDTWNCPEPAASAICVSILNSDVPVGTLWLYSQNQVDFGPADEAAAKLAASIIASKLSRAAAIPRSTKTHHAAAISDLAHWQFASMPTGARVAPGWRVDGMVESSREWATGWHAWDVLPDGTLMLAIAEAEEETVGGAMTAAIARAALTAHTGYRHTPRQLLQRISDTLWQSNTVDQLTSLLYARVDPETGEGEVATAGSINAMIGSRYGHRPVIDSTLQPLASRIDVECNTTTFRLQPGEVLLAHTRGLIDDGATQTMIGNQLSNAMQESNTCPLASIRSAMAGLAINSERGAVTMLREA